MTTIFMNTCVIIFMICAVLFLVDKVRRERKKKASNFSSKKITGDSLDIMAEQYGVKRFDEEPDWHIKSRILEKIHYAMKANDIVNAAGSGYEKLHRFHERYLKEEEEKVS